MTLPAQPESDAASSEDHPPSTGRGRRTRRRGGLTAVICTALCCVAATAVTFTLPRPADAEAYHAAAKEAAAALPLSFGPYEGRDVAMPEEAVTLLRPNVMFARQYRSLHPPVVASLLVAQVRDARDLLGHWPPNCYPSNGYTMEPAELKTWTVAGETVPGVRFRMHILENGQRVEQVVDFFMVLPDGRIARSMETVTDAAARFDWRYYGAAQVQVLTPGGMPDKQRDAVFREMVAAHQPLLDTLRAGRDARPASG